MHACGVCTCAYMCVHVYVCVYICMYMYVCMNVCMRVHVCMCTMCMYVHTYVCVSKSEVNFLLLFLRHHRVFLSDLKLTR